MWTSLEVFICGKNLFSARKPSVVFSPEQCVLNGALFCDSSLLISSAKDKK